MAFTSYPDTGAPLEVRDLVIECDAMPKAELGVVLGDLSSMAIGIVGTMRLDGYQNAIP